LIKRTTAGVNYFRLHHSPTPPAAGVGSSTSDVTIIKAQGWIVDDEYHTAATTSQGISIDNVELRESPDEQIKSFDIHVREPLCEMRPDTKLVLEDTPGINEAGADGKYPSYVREHWLDFDCLVVEMDGRHGASTEEQVRLLDFVHDSSKKAKNIPVVIFCSDLDNPEDPEQKKLVKKAREEVHRIFVCTERRQ
jgi:hypothetical protein